MAIKEQPLSPEQEERYRRVARNLFHPGIAVLDQYHPVIQDEFRRCQEEYDQQHNEESNHA